jgi:hypothetical protein
MQDAARACAGVKLPASASNNIAGPVVILNSGSGDVSVSHDFNDSTNASGTTPSWS